MLQQKQWLLQHNFRQGNTVAHKLAKEASKQSNSTTIKSYACAPSFVLSTTKSDMDNSYIVSKVREVSGVPRAIFLKHPRIITAVARTEPDRLFEDEEVNKGNSTTEGDIPTSELKQKNSQLKKRVVFGLGIGISVGGVVLAGGWVFTVALTAAVFVGAREYFELVRSHGFSDGMTPPPRYVSRVCSVICALMPLLTLYLGQIDVSVTSAAFVVAMALLMQRRIPRFAQLTTLNTGGILDRVDLHIYGCIGILLRENVVTTLWSLMTLMMIPCEGKDTSWLFSLIRSKHKVTYSTVEQHTTYEVRLKVN
ncbi:hypothetical protein K7X08_008054 [Anisodus acutangulus]|uniref:phosphatidate cytidylyltransferase n=1 Tax=Anisodus acutangulus TaxID=402998 RepID=A0A9Q1RPK2_9SOLA|nr:hypothetical protein K7X08_008054 [Anisodus acutangulus]